jgi:hypothetical protein
MQEAAFGPLFLWRSPDASILQTGSAFLAAFAAKIQA